MTRSSHTLLLVTYTLCYAVVGEFVDKLGQTGSIEAETVGILMEHTVATRPFTAEVSVLERIEKWGSQVGTAWSISVAMRLDSRSSPNYTSLSLCLSLPLSAFRDVQLSSLPHTNRCIHSLRTGNGVTAAGSAGRDLVHPCRGARSPA